MIEVNPNLRLRPFTKIIGKCVKDIQNDEDISREMPKQYIFSLSLIPDGWSREQFLAALDAVFEKADKMRKLPVGIEKINFPHYKGLVKDNIGVTLSDIKSLKWGGADTIEKVQQRIAATPKIPTPASMGVSGSVPASAQKQEAPAQETSRPRTGKLEIRNYTDQYIFVTIKNGVIELRPAASKDSKYLPAGPARSDSDKGDFYGKLEV